MRSAELRSAELRSAELRSAELRSSPFLSPQSSLLHSSALHSAQTGKYSGNQWYNGMHVIFVNFYNSETFEFVFVILLLFLSLVSQATFSWIQELIFTKA